MPPDCPRLFGPLDRGDASKDHQSDAVHSRWTQQYILQRERLEHGVKSLTSEVAVK